MVDNGTRKSPNAVSDLKKTLSFRRKASHVFGLTLAKLRVPNCGVPEEALFSEATTTEAYTRVNEEPTEAA